MSLSIILKKNGVINKVKIIENKIPDINTIPIVNLDSYPAPDPKTRGITPTIVDIPVIIIGLNLFLQDSKIALKLFLPWLFNWRANSTINIPFFAAIPIRMIIPIWLKIFNEFSKIIRQIIGINKVNGTDNIIMKGYLKLSNWAHKTK